MIGAASGGAGGTRRHLTNLFRSPRLRPSMQFVSGVYEDPRGGVRIFSPLFASFLIDSTGPYCECSFRGRAEIHPLPAAHSRAGTMRRRRQSAARSVQVQVGPICTLEHPSPRLPAPAVKARLVSMIKRIGAAPLARTKAGPIGARLAKKRAPPE